jgi:CDP-diacylglycerol--glycerol-3-phosphate 3-phosphatidyltransferase
VTTLKDHYTAIVRRGVAPVAERLVNGRVTPNMLTVAGLVLTLAAAPFVVTGHTAIGAVVFLVGSTTDMLDGAVARLGKQVTAFGAFLDSTSDRLAEGVILGAIGLLYARQDHLGRVALVFAVLIASFLVSYTRARAEALGLQCKVGLMSRPERIVLLFIGLLFASFVVLDVVLVVMAVLTWWTVVTRILHVRKQLGSGAGAPRG